MESFQEFCSNTAIYQTVALTDIKMRSLQCFRYYLRSCRSEKCRVLIMVELPVLFYTVLIFFQGTCLSCECCLLARLNFVFACLNK